MEWTLNGTKEWTGWDVKLGGQPSEPMLHTTKWRSSFSRYYLIACVIFSITQFAYLSHRTCNSAIVGWMYHSLACPVSVAMWRLLRFNHE